jgi:hypothetical protein
MNRTKNKKKISTKFLDKRTHIVRRFITKQSPQYFYFFKHLNGQSQENLTIGLFLKNQLPPAEVGTTIFVVYPLNANFFFSVR